MANVKEVVSSFAALPTPEREAALLAMGVLHEVLSRQQALVPAVRRGRLAAITPVNAVAVEQVNEPVDGAVVHGEDDETAF